MYTDPTGHFISFGLSNAVAVMSILGGGATIGYMIWDKSQNSGTNIWLSIALYNGRMWLIEEYNSMMMEVSSQSPYKHLEDEFLAMGQGDPFKKIKDYIEKMKKQIEWRENEPNFKPSSPSYAGHVKRIKILNDKINLLKGYLILGLCTGKK
jgi:hypothetical protein